MSGVIRKARTSDVPAMQRLVNFFADRGEMLHRSLAQFYENLRDFSVAEEDGEVVEFEGRKLDVEVPAKKIVTLRLTPA